MTEQGKYFISEYKKGNVLIESMQTLYKKGHITSAEFTECTGQQPEQIDICPEIKSNQELTEENKLLKEQVKALTEANDFQEELIVEMAALVYA